MNGQDFINKMNAVFLQHAIDADHLAKIDATVREMIKDPAKLTEIENMRADLQNVIEDAFSAEMSSQKLKLRDIRSNASLTSIVETVFETVSTQHPNIFKPIIQREVAIYVTAVVRNEELREQLAQQQNQGPQ